MSIKSLTITEDAYDALKSLKQEDESFSRVILRIRKQVTSPIDKFFGILQNNEERAEEWLVQVKQNRVETEQHMKMRSREFEKIRSKK
ncbi:MAG: antitoxin VapB family protein [Candidatus Woesearchaeota archaeon]|nr:antitoxin VapB family protein [Candidatus Woesearchaeota archaeon]